MGCCNEHAQRCYERIDLSEKNHDCRCQWISLDVFHTVYTVPVSTFGLIFPPPLLNFLIGLDKTNLPTALLRSKSGEQIL